MQLLTAPIIKELNKTPLYSTDGQKGPRKVVVKFFSPDSSWTWYVLEGKQVGEDWEFFGLVEGHEKELGYFTLSDLKTIRGSLRLPIERDRHFRGTIDVETNEVKGL
jgi:hypothetical protein